MNKISFGSRVIYLDCAKESTGVVTADGNAYVFGAIGLNMTKKYNREPDIMKLELDKSAKFITITNRSSGVIFRDGSIQINRWKTNKDKSATWRIEDIKATYIYSKVSNRYGNIYETGVIDEDGNLFLYYFPYSGGTKRIKVELPEPISIVKHDIRFQRKYTALSIYGNVYTWKVNKPCAFTWGQGYGENSYLIKPPTKLNLPSIHRIDNHKNTFGVVTEDGRVFMWGGQAHKKIAPASNIAAKIPFKYLTSTSVKVPAEMSLTTVDKGYGDGMGWVEINRGLTPSYLHESPNEIITDISIGKTHVITLTRVAGLSPEISSGGSTVGAPPKVNFIEDEINPSASAEIPREFRNRNSLESGKIKTWAIPSFVVEEIPV